MNSLHASEQYDIFITGSNAFLLSSDLSTLFTGRTFEIEVFPFSFEEYRLYGDEGEVDRDFDEYARTGGMSGSYPYPLQEQRYQYLSNVFKTLIVRDIVQRHNVRNESALLRIADYMMDNVSNITSARNITDALNADGLKITNNGRHVHGVPVRCVCLLYRPSVRHSRQKIPLRAARSTIWRTMRLNMRFLVHVIWIGDAYTRTWWQSSCCVADTRYTSACSIKRK